MNRFLPMVLLCGFAAAGCSVKTATYGTGESVEVGLARDLAGLATFGTFGREEQEPISYRERPSLVVPPSDQIAAIPEPTDRIDQVDENFPGRADELRRIERRAEKKKSSTVINQFLGDGRTQALGAQKSNDIEREKDDIVGGPNAVVGANESLDARELTKTPEEIAKERGVTVEELPKSLQGDIVRERSILERAGLVQPKRSTRGQPRLTDVPDEYRTVQTNNTDADVEALLQDKKKKKKRFFFF